MEGDCSQGRGLRFHLSEDGNRLQVDYEPDGPVVPVDFAWLKHALDAQRAATGFYLFEHASGEIKKRYNEATGPFSFDIGERRDGSFGIALSPDRTSATLTLSPAYGGTPVSLESVLNALSAEHIVSGVLTDRIESALSSGSEVESLVIAEGRPPANGENAQMLSLLPESAGHDVTETDDQVVDYRDSCIIKSVKAGTPVMRRIPPTLGVSGEDVTGETIPAEDGLDLQFDDNLAGVVFDPLDPDLLIAEIGGMPVLLPCGVNIEPQITVKNVDLSTGNLYFDGSVEIEGDVREGMTLTVAGEVRVKGVVEAATIHSGGSVVIVGGVIGHGQEAPQDVSSQEHAVIKAEGCITALFVENAIIESSADIEIRELAMKSELTANGRIVIGEEGSRKGHLIGGVCRAGAGVKAVVAGSRANVPTRIEVGVEPMASERLTEVQHLLESAEKGFEELEKDIAYCHEHPERFDSGRCSQLERDRQSLQSKIAELAGQKKRLQRKLVPDPDAVVEVEREIFYGVSVKIGDRQLIVDDDQFHGTFRRIGDEVVFLPAS